MKRDIEKDLMEIESAVKSNRERDNVFTMSVLQRCHELVSELKEYKDTGLTPKEILDGKLLTGWVPCSERLPEDDEYILLSFENFSVPLVGRYEDDGEGGAFYVGDDSESCSSQDIIVNAWMPLPEQYREES